jgi:hypothetical protein
MNKTLKVGIAGEKLEVGDVVMFTQRKKDTMGLLSKSLLRHMSVM